MSEKDERSAENFLFQWQQPVVNYTNPYVHCLRQTPNLASVPDTYPTRYRDDTRSEDSTGNHTRRPSKPITKIYMRVEEVEGLNQQLVKDTELIVNIPYGIGTGDRFSVNIDGKEVVLVCPVLGRHQDRFILCFTDDLDSIDTDTVSFESVCTRQDEV